MKVCGKKISDGKYKLARIIGIQLSQISYQVYFLSIKNGEITIFKEEEDVTEEVRRLEFKKNYTIFLWINPSRVGIPFSITPLV
jgi:hypothetical protein